MEVKRKTEEDYEDLLIKNTQNDDSSTIIIQNDDSR